MYGPSRFGFSQSLYCSIILLAGYSGAWHQIHYTPIFVANCFTYQDSNRRCLQSLCRIFLEALFNFKKPSEMVRLSSVGPNRSLTLDGINKWTQYTIKLLDCVPLSMLRGGVGWGANLYTNWHWYVCLSCLFGLKHSLIPVSFKMYQNSNRPFSD